MTRRAQALCAAVLALLAAGPQAEAQRAEPLPADLEDVGVTERLDAPLPLDLELRDERGQSVRLSDYFDSRRPVLLSLVYYECPMLCTLVLDGMLRVLQELDWTPGEQFEIVTVSIDPRETPELAQRKKATYLAAYGRPAAAAGWHFLTADAPAIGSLTDAVGFRYRYLADRGEFAHPAVLFVVTPEGKLSRYLFGVQHDPRTLRLSLVEAAAGRSGSTMDKFLLYCYRYDADAGRYAPVALRIMRLGGGAGALVLGAFLVGLWRREALKRRVKESA